MISVNNFSRYTHQKQRGLAALRAGKPEGWKARTLGSEKARKREDQKKLEGLEA